MSAGFAGRPGAKFELRGSAVNLRSDLDLGFSGAGELRGVTGSVVLDPALVPQLHLQQRGTVSVNLERLELAAGPALRSLRGTLELRDLREMPQNMDIGSYQVTFDSPPQADGGLPGKLRDLGGPFAVEGTGEVASGASVISIVALDNTATENSASGGDTATFRFTNTLAGGAVYEARNNGNATFANNIIVDS